MTALRFSEAADRKVALVFSCCRWYFGKKMLGHNQISVVSASLVLLGFGMVLAMPTATSARNRPTAVIRLYHTESHSGSLTLPLFLPLMCLDASMSLRHVLREPRATYVVRLQLDSVPEEVRSVAGVLEHFVEGILVLGNKHTHTHTMPFFLCQWA